MRWIAILIVMLPMWVIGQNMGRYPNAVTPTAAGGDEPEQYEAFAFWKFNGDLTDEYGNNDGSAVNTIAYSGDTALIFSESDGNDAVNIGNIITGDFSVSSWILLDENANENYYFMGNGTSSDNSVWYIYFNGTGTGLFNPLMHSRDGSGNSDYAYGSADISVDTWTHFVMVVDEDYGPGKASVNFYIDGEHSYVDSTLIYSINVSGTTHVGNTETTGGAGGFREGAMIGECVLFDEQLTEENIDSLYSIGGDRLWYVE